MSLPATSDAAACRKLFSAARELFARKGYMGTTVREIVAAAGVTKPVLYYYFRSKEGIYLEVIGTAFKKLDELLDDFRGWPGSATERLNVLCDRVFLLFTHQQETLCLIQGPQPGAPFYDFEASYRRLQNAIRQLIKEGIRQKEFKNTNAEAGVSAVIGVLYIAAQERLKHREWGTNQKRSPGALRIIFNGIGMHGAKAKSR